MSHLKLKSLLFYTAMISTVLALFQGINLYGTTQIKAPQKMTGIYDIDLVNNSQCFPKQMKLDLEQSGIYFFGNLNINPSSEEILDKNMIKINGKLNSQKLLLSGKFHQTSPCFNNQNKLILVIEPPVEKDEIKGYLMENENQVGFKGKLQSELSPSENKH